MKLKILLPEKVLLEKEAESIVVEAEDGSLGLLPGHVDFTAAVVPGIVSYTDKEGNEEFSATDRGVLLKQGEHVSISVQSGITGTNLGLLREAVDEFMEKRQEFEKRSRYALGMLEADFLRRYVEME